MSLLALPTLDGTAEAAVERLSAWESQYRAEHVKEAVDVARGSLCELGELMVQVKDKDLVLELRQEYARIDTALDVVSIGGAADLLRDWDATYRRARENS